MTLPVTVLTGFLGAGKTTLLRRVLARPHGLRIGLIVNELGVAGIDDLGAIGGGPGREPTYLELTEGCVCCTRNPDLIAALAELHARGDLDRIVVETSGVADPMALTFVLARPDVAQVARLDGVVTVVDAANFAATAATEEWQAQVRAADLVLVSKLDLVPPAAHEAARAAVAALNGAARFVEGDADETAAVLFDAELIGPRAAPTGAPPQPHHNRFAALSVADAGAYRLDRLEDLLEDLPAAVFRAKGVARGPDGHWVTFHSVGGRLHLVPDTPAPAHGESRMVFLGRGFDEAALRASVADCRA